MPITALIAEDEPLLAQALQSALAKIWPDLHIVATVGDGLSAVERSIALSPDILFFDVRMPGLDGLDAASDIADRWPVVQALPLLVFVTAYDQYAVQAFERQAVDYLLKPVQNARLAQCVERLKPLAQARYAQAAIESIANNNETTLEQLRHLQNLRQASPGPAANTPLLTRITASVGNQIHMVAIEDVLYFEAADKYVRVITADKEYLIRTPIKDLLPQLNPQEFWQIHRSIVVRASAIDTVQLGENAKLSLKLLGSPDKLAVSRLYAHLFKAM